MKNILMILLALMGLAGANAQTNILLSGFDGSGFAGPQLGPTLIVSTNLWVSNNLTVGGSNVFAGTTWQTNTAGTNVSSGGGFTNIFNGSQTGIAAGQFSGNGGALTNLIAGTLQYASGALVLNGGGAIKFFSIGPFANSTTGGTVLVNSQTAIPFQAPFILTNFVNGNNTLAVGTGTNCMIRYFTNGVWDSAFTIIYTGTPQAFAAQADTTDTIYFGGTGWTNSIVAQWSNMITSATGTLAVFGSCQVLK